MEELKYIVMQSNGKIVAVFMRRWEAEKFIEAADHGYELVIKTLDNDKYKEGI